MTQPQGRAIVGVAHVPANGPAPLPSWFPPVMMPPSFDVIAAEALIRGSVFVLLLAGFALAERRWPRRGRTRMLERRRRWVANLGLALAGTLVLRLIFPAAAVGAALAAEASGAGLFAVIGLPAWAAVPAGFVLLDLAVWAQHLVMHRVPVLWRLHRIHHLDTALDVTSGLRFHPVEILLSMAWKIAVIWLLGVPAIAVLAFEVALNAASLFNHADLNLGATVDRRLARLIATPDWHRVHHSAVRRETDSNYAFFFTLWDRLFGTARPVPAAGHDAMAIGLDDAAAARDGRAGPAALLLRPFLTPPAGASMVNPHKAAAGLPAAPGSDPGTPAQPLRPGGG